MTAQKTLKTYSFRDSGNKDLQIVSSTEPCAMCMGAIAWTGISGLICGARDQDARNVGFEEGLKPKDWQKWFKEHGIHVQLDVLRKDAAQVLLDYQSRGGEIYNGVGE